MPSVSLIVSGSFGFMRRHIGVVATWCVVYSVGALACAFTMSPVDWVAIAAASGGGQAPPGFLGRLLANYAIMVVLFTALFAAAFRAVMTPEESRAAYLRLKGDELRLFGLMVVLFVGGGLFTIIVGVVLALGAAFLAAMLGGGAMGNGALALLVSLAVFVPPIWLAVRLSPAGPLTILRGRIVIGEAWRLSRRRFWTLFGGYLVVGLAILIPFLIFFGITMGSYLVANLNAMGDPAAMQATMQEQMRVMAPGTLRWLVVFVPSVVLGGVAIALQGAMLATATRALLAEAS